MAHPRTDGYPQMNHGFAQHFEGFFGSMKHGHLIVLKVIKLGEVLKYPPIPHHAEGDHLVGTDGPHGAKPENSDA